MRKTDHITRRSLLGRVAAGATAAAGALPAASHSQESPPAPDNQAAQPKRLKARIQQSVCRWCYQKMPLDDLAREAARIGIVAMDLIGPSEWDTVMKYGLKPSMGFSGSTIPDGPNTKANHQRLEAEFHKNVELAAKAGVPNLICFSGNRRGMSDEEGLDNCTAFLRKVMPHAEDRGILICMELLNSKVNHKDYMCDHTAWGVELVKRVGSPKFKLLYDIYHMQIMEGDVIRTIRDNIQYLAHFHTGGVPGRNELDDTQELNYATITRAIIETGFSGYMAHEFIPKRDPMTSLREAVLLCDV